MNYDESTLELRQSLWVALSDLFLDTQLQDYNHLYIAKAMEASGYTLDEIEEILMMEVFPVCIANLHDVAGEWSGFDETSVCDASIAAKSPARYRRWMNRRNFWMIKDDWQKVVEVFSSLQVFRKRGRLLFYFLITAAIS